jgi:hypothetical protein
VLNDAIGQFLGTIFWFSAVMHRAAFRVLKDAITNRTRRNEPDGEIDSVGCT